MGEIISKIGELSTQQAKTETKVEIVNADLKTTTEEVKATKKDLEQSRKEIETLLSQNAAALKAKFEGMSEDVREKLVGMRTRTCSRWRGAGERRG